MSQTVKKWLEKVSDPTDFPWPECLESGEKGEEEENVSLDQDLVQDQDLNQSFDQEGKPGKSIFSNTF